MKNISGLSQPAFPRRTYINRIETAVPESEGHKKFLDFLPRLVSDPRLLVLIQRLASKSQIERRYTVFGIAEQSELLDREGFFRPGQFASTAQRMRKYQEEALPLASKAVERVLRGIDRRTITHLILTSCTGFYAPGLDLELQAAFDLRADLERSLVGFMGCHAAFNALKAANYIVQARPEAKVLIVNLELCSLHLQDLSQIPEGSAEEVVANQARRALGFLQFADGCAASLISSEPTGFAIERFRCETIGSRSELIRWTIGDDGFEMYLSLDVPRALGEALPSRLPNIMSGAERAATRLWAVHPGGRSILDVVQNKLELTDLEMAPSREVLRNFGNMSSATIMFVLRALLEDPKAKGPGQAFAFGPGLTVESMRFHKASADAH